MAPPMINADNVQMYQQFQAQMRAKGVSDEQINDLWNTAYTKGTSALSKNPLTGQGNIVNHGIDYNSINRDVLGQYGGATTGLSQIAPPPGSYNPLQNLGVLLATGHTADELYQKSGGGGQVQKFEPKGDRLQPLNRRITPGINPNPQHHTIQHGSGPSALDTLLEQLAALNGQDSGSAQYNDFTDRASQIVNGILGPQYGALSGAENNARQQSTMNDSVLAGLYSKLQADANAQKGAVAQQTAQSQQANTANTAGLQKTLADNYQGANESQGKMLKMLGIESAAPTTFQQATKNQQFQQGQAAQLGQAQGDYLTNAGQNMQNYVGGVGLAAGATGVAARQQNIRGLANALMQIQNQRAQLDSNKAQSVLDLSQSLSDRDYNVQRDAQTSRQAAIEQQRQNLLDAYKLKTDAEATNFDRGYKTTQLKMEQDAAAGKANQYDSDSVTTDANFTRQMVNSYGGDGTAAIQVAMDVVGGNSAQDLGSYGAFVNRIVSAGRAAGVKNTQALIAAANYYAKSANFKTTGM